VKKRDAKEEAVIVGLEQGSKSFNSIVASQAREAWLDRVKVGETILLEGKED
jgi:hypothetical protein